MVLCWLLAMYSGNERNCFHDIAYLDCDQYQDYFLNPKINEQTVILA